MEGGSAKRCPPVSDAIVADQETHFRWTAAIAVCQIGIPGRSMARAGPLGPHIFGARLVQALSIRLQLLISARSASGIAARSPGPLRAMGSSGASESSHLYRHEGAG